MTPRIPLLRCPRTAVAGAPPLRPFALADASGPASWQTRLRCAWEPAALLLQFECDDPAPWATFARDNDPIYNEEVVEAFIDPDPEDGEYLEVELSPDNVRFAALIRNDGSPPWQEIEALLDCSPMETRIDSAPGAWVALWRIPFAPMGLPEPKVGDEWRINFYRIKRPGGAANPEAGAEYSCWSPTLTEPAAFHRPARFGRIRFE